MSQTTQTTTSQTPVKFSTDLTLWWRFWRFLCYLWFGFFYRYRAFGRQNLPKDGPVLILSNHQSFLDPILAGMAANNRAFYALARSTLWKNKFVGWGINSFNALPVDRGESDIKAMRKCIDVLNQHKALLLFPEGTRTTDGQTKPFTPGLMLLVKKARPTVLPIAIEGARDAWPKERKIPRLFGKIKVNVGKPIPADDLLKVDTDTALKTLHDTIESLRLDLTNKH